MAYEELFQVFEMKNTEAKSLVEFCHECAWHTGKEQTASISIGIHEHAARRTQAWIDAGNARLDALAGHPIPDLPSSHPIIVLAECSKVPDMPRHEDGRVVNQDSENLMVMWQRCAYELARCNSAALGGGLLPYDTIRCRQNLASIQQFLDSVSRDLVQVDFPETADPGAKTTSLQGQLIG